MTFITVMADQGYAGEPHQDIQLWRTGFIAWGGDAPVPRDTWCLPRRYVVVEEGRVLATGESHGPYLVPGETYHLVEKEPAA